MELSVTSRITIEPCLKPGTELEVKFLTLLNTIF